MRYFFTLLLCVLALPTFAQGNPEQGKIKSPSCVFCHGKNGHAVDAQYPNLAGQNAEYLYRAMKAYQQGQRESQFSKMMQAQLSKLSDQDLKDVAAFYANQSASD